MWSDFIISDKWWFIDIESGVVFVEPMSWLAYFIFIVEMSPESIENLLNRSNNNDEIVVLPLVPVIPIRSILEDGLS